MYIDHDARVYQDWNSYLTQNKLPKGVLVVPKNGEYRGIILRVSMYVADIEFMLTIFFPVYLIISMTFF